MTTKPKIRVFACPAGNYLNRHNEKGSLGLIVYQIIEAVVALGKVTYTAVNFKSYGVENRHALKVVDVLQDYQPNGRKSLLFYLKTFFEFRNKREFKQAHIVHHMLPFGYLLGFNLFFIFKKKNKGYVLGPIIGKHLNLVSLDDDAYYFGRTKPFNLWDKFLFRLSEVAASFLRIVLFVPHWLTLKRADVVIFSDQYAYQPYKKMVDPKRIEIIPVGCDFEKFHRKPTPKSETFEILFVGRLGRRKGAHLALEAFEQLLGRIQEKVCLRIVGDGAMFHELKHEAQKKGLEKVVIFEGNVSNFRLGSYYNRADLFWLPALSDTWMTTMEALSCGLPVITTNIGAHPEHVIDGVNGYLVEPFSTKQIVDRTIQLLNDRNLLGKLGDNALSIAKQRYNLTRIARRYLKIYEGLFAKYSQFSE